MIYSKKLSVRGYTLIELIVAVGLFAIVMTISSGAYLIMINANRKAQSITTGINNLSFVLEGMTRDIRTGTAYGCGAVGVDCPISISGGSSFTFTDANNNPNITYAKGTQAGVGDITKGGVAITDASVDITSLKFYLSGAKTVRDIDTAQPYVTIVVSGRVSAGPGKWEDFTVETSAAMRGTDL